MGIKGLGQFIRDKFPRAITSHQLKNFSGSRIAIDATNVVIMNYAAATAMAHKESSVGSNPSVEEIEGMWMDLMRSTISKFVRSNVTPIFVFDGTAPEEKSGELEKRSLERKKVSNKIQEIETYIEDEKSKLQVDVGGGLLDQPSDFSEEFKEKVVQLESLKKRKFFVSKEAWNTLHTFIRSCGIPIMCAYGEAEKLCSSLVNFGVAIAVYSADTDVLAHGASKLVSKIRGYTCTTIDRNVLLQDMNLEDDQFLDFCITCGCDYNEKIPNVGPVTAYKMISKYGSIDSLTVDTKCLNHLECRELFANKEPDELVENMSIDYSTQVIDRAFISMMHQEEWFRLIFEAMKIFKLKRRLNVILDF